MTPIRRTAIKNKYISLMVVGTHLAIFPNTPGAIFSWSSEAYLFVSSTISPTSSSVKNSLKHWTSVADAGGVCIPDFELSKVIPGPGGVKLLVAVQGELTCSAKLDVSPCVRVAAERPASPFSRPWRLGGSSSSESLSLVSLSEHTSSSELKNISLISSVSFFLKISTEIDVLMLLVNYFPQVIALLVC